MALFTTNLTSAEDGIGHLTSAEEGIGHLTSAEDGIGHLTSAEDGIGHLTSAEDGIGWWWRDSALEFCAAAQRFLHCYLTHLKF